MSQEPKFDYRVQALIDGELSELQEEFVVQKILIDKKLFKQYRILRIQDKMLKNKKLRER